MLRALGETFHIVLLKGKVSTIKINQQPSKAQSTFDEKQHHQPFTPLHLRKTSDIGSAPTHEEPPTETTVPVTLRVGPGSSKTELCRMNDRHDAGALSNTGASSDPERGLYPGKLSDDNAAPTTRFFPEA